jgi:ribosomal protein S18 acetylase RimI-like enzyme
MRRKDASTIARMMKGLAAFHGDESNVTAKHFVQYCLSRDKLSDAWIAFIGDKPAGFITTYDWINFHRLMKVRKIDLLYVEGAFRGLGVGAALIDKVIKDASLKKIKRIDIGASKKNRYANSFYSRLGFEKRVPYSNEYKIEGAALKKLSKNNNP